MRTSFERNAAGVRPVRALDLRLAFFGQAEALVRTSPAVSPSVVPLCRTSVPSFPAPPFSSPFFFSSVCEVILTLFVRNARVPQFRSVSRARSPSRQIELSPLRHMGRYRRPFHLPAGPSRCAGPRKCRCGRFDGWKRGLPRAYSLWLTVLLDHRVALCASDTKSCVPFQTEIPR